MIDLKEWPDEIALHTMSTSVAHWDNDVRGELIRCVAEGKVSYEARINGTEETYGFSDIAAYSIDKLSALAKVANDLRYEWAQITGLHEGVTWSVLWPAETSTDPPRPSDHRATRVRWSLAVGALTESSTLPTHCWPRPARPTGCPLIKSRTNQYLRIRQFPDKTAREVGKSPT
jgi:hypothetical protein